MTVLHIDIPSQSLQEEQVITLNSELFIQGVKRGDAGKLLESPDHDIGTMSRIVLLRGKEQSGSDQQVGRAGGLL